MRNILLIFFSLLIFNVSFGQTVFTKLIEKKYSELPVHLRIENSGIYAVSSFDVENNNIWIQDFDSHVVYHITGNQLQKSNSKIKIGKDFIAGTKQRNVLLNKNYSSSNEENITLKKSFLFNKENIFADNGGILTDAENDKIIINVKSRNELILRYEIPGFNKNFVFNNLSNLVFAELIGIDASGNSFILTESYLSEIPLKVKREVYTISNEGKIRSILEIPSIKYLYMVKEFQIDAEGNLYQLIADEDKISVVKWRGLTNYSSSKISYPPEYNYELNYNNLTPTKEAKNGLNKVTGLQSASRSYALRIGESYVLYKYTCKSNNLSPTNVTGPDGDVVRTPNWLIVGENARIPYRWGGFNTLSQFKSGLNSGKYAGDINTAGVSNYSVGVDCSGFVSRCWQLSYQSSTRDMPSITTQYSSWDDIKPGDAIHKIGHVRLFIDKTSGGALRVVESSARNWDVSYWTYKPSDLTSYTPRYYNGMVNDYSFNQPKLISVLNENNRKVKITWECDTSKVIGYRLYKSTDGTEWNLVKDITVLDSMSIVISMDSSAEYFRIASVLNNPPSYSESNWSNVLGAGEMGGSKKILIVDGFNRETGDWRGNGNTFSAVYGIAFTDLGINFESVKNSQIINFSIDLNNYDAVYWILGDESTVDETFDSVEQNKVKSYLENGGNLFVSGSEIGWDLYYKGSTEDKYFYNNYLKANYIEDNSSSNSVAGINGTALAGTNIYFAQTYEVNYPDVIDSYGGSSLCMKYANNKGAGVEYTGTFGASKAIAKLINLGFPLESTANDVEFNAVISQSSEYFFPGVTSTTRVKINPLEYNLSQNYPNPFNPSTTIKYTIAKTSIVTLKIYDLLGREIVTLVNTIKDPGTYTSEFNGKNLASGCYIYKINMKPSDGSSGFNLAKKILLLK